MELVWRILAVLVALAVLAAACLGLAAGCGGPSEVQVPMGDGSAQLKRGNVLRVDLGEVNASIGDSWYLIQDPDPAVLDEGERDYDADCDEPGCGGRMAWLFTARGPGTTTLVFRYCYRSRPDDCEPQPDRGPDQPVKLTVTVT